MREDLEGIPSGRPGSTNLAQMDFFQEPPRVPCQESTACLRPRKGYAQISSWDAGPNCDR